MRTRVRPIFAIAVALAVTAFLGLGVIAESPAYAKGPVASSGGGGSSSSSGSGSGSGSSHSSDSGSSHSSSSSSSHSSSSGSGGSSSSQSWSGSGSSSRSSDARVYRSPSSSSTNRLDQDYYVRTLPSQSGSRQPAPTYRKDYAAIGDLWKSRQERRTVGNSPSTSESRHGSTYDHRYDAGRDQDRGSWYYDRRDDHGWGFSIYTSPFRYHYYCYDYRPTMCYPSPYCYYYDYYPPYVYYDRVVIIAHPAHHVYVEVPVFVYRSTSDYYLTNPADKSLWGALRDIQLAWEKSDAERLMKHVDRSGTIDVYLDDEYTYSVNRLDYYDMTLDAMTVIRTRSLDFDRVNREDGNRYVARGTHVYTDRYGSMKSVYIEYTLQRYGSEWYIIAVGTSTRQI